MLKPVIKIGVVSDVVCPWCYIGKRRLEKAIGMLSGEMEFEIAYYPFELNPDIPAKGLKQKEYLTGKFGGEEAYRKITQQTTAAAKQEGLIFNFDKQAVLPNTRNAHRLILYAREEGKQLQLAELLFRAYFTDGTDLSDMENLADISAEAGLNREKVEQFLESDSGMTEVMIAETELQRMGIRSVPFYIINDRYGISGAQPSEAFIQAFKNATAEFTEAGS